MPRNSTFLILLKHGSSCSFAACRNGYCRSEELPEMRRIAPSRTHFSDTPTPPARQKNWRPWQGSLRAIHHQRGKYLSLRTWGCSIGALVTGAKRSRHGRRLGRLVRVRLSWTENWLLTGHL